ncbi:MAG: hypothetical protein JO092_08520 [Candidatus Eremiobacteraeota bacterium]|nr:hypothetical protein [Candidatus Eremiobacteraeota bacterium]
MQRLALYAAVFLGTFGIYMSNGAFLGAADSVATTEFALNALQRHRLDFDEFEKSDFARGDAHYGFVQSHDHHLTTMFPIGTALLTFPAYAVLYVKYGAQPITSPAYEQTRRRIEKTLAALLAALCAVLFLATALLVSTPLQAGVATVVFALGTEMWTIGSQALWQHGPVNLILLAAIYSTIRAARATRFAGIWLALAGFCCGFLPVIRPTALIFAMAISAFLALRLRWRCAPFVLGTAIGLAPGVLWNWHTFHSPFGGYERDLDFFSANAHDVLVRVAGLLVSPSRGLFVYTPVFIFSIIAMAALRRLPQFEARLLLVLAFASAALVACYGFYDEWWGGWTYGPRFLTDVVGVGALLLATWLPRDVTALSNGGMRARTATVAFCIAAFASIAVQYVGANAGAAGVDWNRIPYSIDEMPARIWSLHDSQIQRNLFAIYREKFDWKLAQGPEYRQGLRGQVVDLAVPSSVMPGAALRPNAVLTNAGRSVQYGYERGVFVGQARVCVQILDAAGHLDSTQWLYIAQDVAPGARVSAAGTLFAPSIPGSYALRAFPYALGIGPIAGSALTRALIVSGASRGR